MNETDTAVRLWSQKVVEYFDVSWPSYRRYMNQRAKAFHLGFWDETTRDRGDALLNMNKQMATRVGLTRGEKVLDAGCGVGGTAIFLALNYDVEVTGVTLPIAQVEAATHYAAESGVADRVRFRQADFADTKLPDASFDVVWGQESICQSPRKPDFFREAFRILKPGGRMIIEDGFRRRRPYGAPEEQLLRECGDGWAVPDFATPEEFCGWAEDAGFQGGSIEDITPYTLPSFRQIRVRLMLDYWRRRVWQLFGLASNRVLLLHARSGVRAYQLIRRQLTVIAFFRATKPN